jgi:hypothetical protein
LFTLQYLEPSPHLAEIAPKDVRLKLRAAFNIIPVDALLLGWDIPKSLGDVCREETARNGVKLFRWHPLLCDDGNIAPDEDWWTKNFRGVPLSGFRGLPEFTFVCPNHPAARNAILLNLQSIAESSDYDGIFLDRMRFPSPAENPIESLACFCQQCIRVAADSGIDLVKIQKTLPQMKKLEVLRSFFSYVSNYDSLELKTFLDFRQRAISQFVGEAVNLIKNADLEVGLDCFSPSLTRMVGQDLEALSPLVDWTKIMVYGHAYGPASLPYELTHLAEWLVQDGDMSESKALESISKIFGFSLPSSLREFRSRGMESEDLVLEYSRGIRNSDSKLLAGIELVDIPGISELSTAQIEADLGALKETGADGLAISWDLWQIPLERLELVARLWV